MESIPDIGLYNTFYSGANLTAYAGEWVVIIDKAIVAHGENVKKLLKEVKKKYPDETPFIAKVPIKEILIW